MKLVNIISKEVIAEMTATKGLTIEEVVEIMDGEIYNENEDENVLIDGVWYYYDDLDYISDEQYEELLAM